MENVSVVCRKKKTSSQGDKMVPFIEQPATALYAVSDPQPIVKKPVPGMSCQCQRNGYVTYRSHATSGETGGVYVRPLMCAGQGDLILFVMLGKSGGVYFWIWIWEKNVNTST